MAADCFLISLDRIELAGAQFDPLSLLGTVGFFRQKTAYVVTV